MKEKRQRPGGRAAQVRQAVLSAARELYVPGEPLPSLTEIATKADVQRTTLYRRWGSVEAILLDAVGADIQKAILIPNLGSLQQDLVAFARASQRFHRSKAGKDLVAMLLGASDHVKQTYWKGRYAALQEIFRNAVQREEIAPRKDWDFYLDLLIAPWYFCTWGKAERWQLESAERLADVVSRIV